ncbi:MAG: hypothetical protein GY856_25040, partial [bacterium]|nr:hypothetical protein [bacterium]
LGDQGRDLARDLESLHLPPMAEFEGHKQVAAKLRSTGASGLDGKRISRIVTTARGNPGLQDLLFGLQLAAPEACDGALDEMEAFLAEGQEPSQQEILDFLANLALDGLFAVLSANERELLRASTLFEVPVPLQVLEGLACAKDIVAGEPAGSRLLALGLWEAHRVGRDETVAVNALVRHRAGELGDDERPKLAGLVVGPLFKAWGGDRGRQGRSYAADHELARLALLAVDLKVLAATAADAVAGLENRFAYREAASLGQAAVSELTQGGREAPLGLLRQAGEVCVRTGDVRAARGFYARAREQLESVVEGEGPDA